MENILLKENLRRFKTKNLKEQLSIDEGVATVAPLSQFPEGFYTLTKVDPNTVREGAIVLVKNVAELTIYQGHFTFPKGKPAGGGTLWK
jgi:hypothetical protein